MIDIKTFFSAIKWGLLFQAICWGSFILFDENSFMGEGAAIICGIIILIGVLVFYLLKANKYLKKNKFKPLMFNIILFIFWVISSFAMTTLLLELVNNGYLHVCGGDGWDCFLNGIEYFFYGLFMVVLAILIILINIIIMIYKFIKKKRKKQK